MIRAGEIYLWSSPLTDSPQRVRVQRVSRDGRWVDVVGEMQGIWMRHGWRTRINKLAPLRTDQ